MSESAPERAARPRRGGGITGALKQKMGPWPAWVWLVILTGAALGYYLWEKHKQGAAGGAAADGQDQGAEEEISGELQVPETVVQNYLSVPAPPEPAPTPSSPGKPRKKEHRTFRQTAPGGKSLAQIAKERHTSVAHLIKATEYEAGTKGHITKANLAKFEKYAKHPHHKIPKGTVFYTTNPGPGVTPRSHGGP